MYYLPSFETVKRKLPMMARDGTVHVNVSYEGFLAIIKEFLSIVAVDEQWYCETYPDVREAISLGECASAQAHFVDNGYFEGRLPYDMEVDEEWYLRVNEDVATRVRAGELRSAKEHFIRHGYVEGRQPAPSKAPAPSERLGSSTAMSFSENAAPQPGGSQPRRSRLGSRAETYTRS